MNNYQDLICSLHERKKLRLKFWPTDKYIYYWNHIILTETGGLFDITHALACSRPDEWEVYNEQLTFGQLTVGDRFKCIPGDHVHIKTLIEQGTGTRFTGKEIAYNTVLGTYIDFGPQALVRKV